jgi:hypothetical protein
MVGRSVSIGDGSNKMRALRLEALWVALLLCFCWGTSAASEHVFCGEECFPSSVSPIPECPIDDACGINSTCFVWKSGKSVNLVPTEHAEQRSRMLPNPCYARSYANNDSFFVNDTWTNGSCALTRVPKHPMRTIVATLFTISAASK